MVNIKEEISKHSPTELKQKANDIIADLEKDTSLDHTTALSIVMRIALLATHQVYPFPLSEDAFILSPEQSYFRARFTEEIMTSFSKNIK